MIGSAVCLVIFVVLYITANVYCDTFPFLQSLLTPLMWICIGFAVLLALFIVIKLIKEIFRK